MPERPKHVQVLYDALDSTLKDGSPDWSNRVKAAIRLDVRGERGIRIPKRDDRGVWHDDEPS